MSNLSKKFTSLAAKLVAKFGVVSQWVLVKKSSISSDNDPTSYSETVTDEFVIDLSIVSWKESDYNGKTIKVGDLPAIMPIKTGYPIPEVGDLLYSRDRHLNYRIVAPLKIFSVNGEPVAYKLNLRG